MKEFFSTFPTVKYKNHEIIIGANKIPQGVYYIQKGFVKMDVFFENGAEITFNIFKPGSFFPMTWVIGEVENSYEFTAIGETCISIAPKSDFLKFIKNNPDTLFDLTKRLLIGMEGLLDGLRNVINGKAGERVTWVINMLAKRFGKNLDNGNILIELKLTHQDISKLVGLTRETTSLELEKLVKNKYITLKKGYITLLPRTY